MALPLVRQVLELFDATIIDVRPEAAPNTGDPGAGALPPPAADAASAAPNAVRDLSDPPGEPPDDPPHEEPDDV
jgi:hypothetical protein